MPLPWSGADYYVVVPPFTCILIDLAPTLLLDFLILSNDGVSTVVLPKRPE